MHSQLATSKKRDSSLVLIEVFEPATRTKEVAGSAEHMILLAWLLVHDEGGFFDQPTKDFFRAFESAFQLNVSDPFFACLAEFYLATPLGF